KVICLDLDERKCDLAAKLCQDARITRSSEDFTKMAEQVSRGFGVDAVIIAAASKDNSPLLLAEEICRRRGTIVLVGVADIRLTRKTMWEKEIKFMVSKAAGPGSIDPTYEKKGLDYPIEYVRWAEKRNLQEFVSLLAGGKVNVKDLITHSYPISDALQAYDTILNSSDLYVGVLLTYDKQPEPETRIDLHALAAQTGRSVNVGLIGAGLFAKNILLPVLKKLKGINPVGVATTSGHSSVHVGKKFGFSYATTDYKKILDDSRVDSVLIATPHNLHARMVMEALKAGKHVFVEKPLCLNRAELTEIVACLTALETKPKLMTGFNRPFSPLARKARELIENRTCPLVLHYRVNAGYMPPDHWVHDMGVGGGRIVGEVCHFIHFLEFLTGSEPVTVFCQAICGETGKYLGEDNTIINLSFRDGSIGTILYSAQGSKSFSRERVEIFSEDTVVVIEDFKKLLHVAGNKKKTVSLSGQDMGYKGELQFFLESDDFDETVFQKDSSAMLATFSALESLQKGTPVNIKS
ncbi:MAG: Gfo/Idh/MocA family oxidoreductase, partial [Phycisphaerae bacterium]|nr:Gfo/Idh/MocA family oxidoreductase [Phycisphaerae bacterium]